MDQFAHERQRSLKSVQVIFAVLAILSLSAALAVAARGVEFGLPETSTRTIAIAFLMVGIADTVLLFLWERIFHRMQSYE
ncbi:MAG: hypothetical protein WBP38_05560 [Hyphomicrobium sp.]|jgi:hypothetical protein|nr:hypothetical protein [Hyphomicrobium sp.]